MLVDVMLQDNMHVGVRGGAKVSASSNIRRLLHAEDVRLADVVDMHQWYGAEEGL